MFEALCYVDTAAGVPCYTVAEFRASIPWVVGSCLLLILLVLMFVRSEKLEREMETQSLRISDLYEELEVASSYLTAYEHEVIDHDLTKQALRIQSRRVEQLSSCDAHVQEYDLYTDIP
jgi:hypothetical protein